MFGDIGHGLILLLFSWYIIENMNNKHLHSFIKFRYMILMMGFFSIYCGVIYNDMMSFPINLFASCYSLQGNKSLKGCVYPVGIDPRW